jgi:Ca-activated chloride channel family protein
VATSGRTLPLRATTLSARAGAGLARVILEQRFANPHPEPLRVTYSLPLPADGVVAAFAFRIGDRRIVGEVDRRQAARQRFEQALVEGRSAALVEQERSSLFTQEIGNVPPGAEIICEVSIDQPLAWLTEGAWEWRFPTVVMPRYLGAEGRVPDAPAIEQDASDAELAVRARLELAIADALAAGARPNSPSHGIVTRAEASELLVSLAEEGGARLDRDLVVRWPVERLQVGAAVQTGRPAAEKPHAGFGYALLTLVPPPAALQTPALPRDLIVLLDTSGSMSGEPLDQARRIVFALLDTLGETDQLELIEFSNRPRRWRRGAVRADASALADARRWLSGLEAGGGTEMRDGILEALSPLRADSQRQVVLVTDGAIGFEAEILGAILERLPAGSRLHTVGVGSAVNRSLTAPAARAGRGVEVVVGLGEDVERAARRLCARTAQPLVCEVELSGSALCGQAPARLPDLYAGSPALCALRLLPGGGELRVRGRIPGGHWEERVVIPPLAEGAGNPAVVGLFGRETVEDLELARAAGGSARSLDEAIERIGLEFQIATRLTSWVAVSEQPTVDPGAPIVRERMPHELPFGVAIEGLGLRAAAPMGVLQAQAASAGRGAFTGGMTRSRLAAPSAAPSKSKSAAADDGSSTRDLIEPSAKDPETFAERARGGRVRILRGRVVLASATELVLEVTVDDDEALDFQPAQRARLELADGSLLEAAVDPQKSTRAPARIAAGRTLRLSLLPTGPLGAPLRAVELGLGATALRILVGA